MFFYFMFSVMRLRDIGKTIMQDVQSGAVEVLLNKPIFYISYRAWWQVGSGIYSFLVIGIVGTIMLALFAGVPHTMTTIAFSLTFLLTFLLGVILSLLLYAIFGLLSFLIQ